MLLIPLLYSWVLHGIEAMGIILDLLRERGWINLYLDDLRDTPAGFLAVRTVEEAISYLTNYNIHLLSLDHDLGVDEEGKLLPTGYDLVKYICEKGIRSSKVILHTDYIVGRDAMHQTLLVAQQRGLIDEDIGIYPYPIAPNRYSGN